MTSTTTYMVQTFDLTVNGSLAGAQVWCQSAAEAIRTGASIVPTKVGAVALATTSEHLTIRHVRVLGEWGDVPLIFLSTLHSG